MVVNGVVLTGGGKLVSLPCQVVCWLPEVGCRASHRVLLPTNFILLIVVYVRSVVAFRF